MRTTLRIFAACLLLAANFSVFAQTQFQSTTLMGELPPEPQLVEPDAVPIAATFYMLSDFQQDDGAPPYPFNPFSQAAVYSTAAEGIYVVDDSEARPGLFQATTNVDLTTLQIWEHVAMLVQSIQMKQADQELSLAMSGEGLNLMSGEESGESSFTALFSSDDLWLEMISKTNAIGNFAIHIPAAEEGTGAYDIYTYFHIGLFKQDKSANGQPELAARWSQNWNR
jgi:hypothetical protein